MNIGTFMFKVRKNIIEIKILYKNFAKIARVFDMFARLI